MLRATTVDAATLRTMFGYGVDVEVREEQAVVKTRIRMMLDRAFHLNTPEAESGQSLRLAQALCRNIACRSKTCARRLNRIKGACLESS